MAGKILNKQKLRFYFFKKIPKNIFLASFFLLVSLILLKTEDKRINQRILGLQTQLNTDLKTTYDWEQILAERPDYRDGWIQLSAIYYKLGEKQKAKEAILKAKSLDPNNQTILSLEEIFGNN